MADLTYNPSDYGKKEEELYAKYSEQLDDARRYFETQTKPRLDRSYKLYISYIGDRAKQIKKWQSNIFVPYTHGVVETLMPRILDARPEFTVQGRTQDDQDKASKLQSLQDYTWEVSKMDKTAESVTRASLVYGAGFMQVSWKKDKRKHKFLSTKDISKKKYTWKEKEQVFYDAPTAEWVDNYDLWYDPHNVRHEEKEYWFKRLILTENSLKNRYPMADKKRLKMALESGAGDLTDYGKVRLEVRLTHDKIYKGADHAGSTIDTYGETHSQKDDAIIKMHEVFEWWRPLDDEYGVWVNGVPILKGSSIPNPYDFKEAPFIQIPYLKIPGEYEGYGLPIILESPQMMLNMIKNQRLDATTLNIHKMWIVNPLANINKEELVTRPFGIIYSTDPNGAREVEFSDVKPSAYREEELLKADMRYSAGVDDFSMGAGGGASSATEVRHLRESTLERVRLFVNHMGDGFADVMRFWTAMYRQFYTQKMIIRITGDDGEPAYPIIEKDDLTGHFDFKANVIPSIAGMNDVKRKQDMDLFQLLINLPFIDPKMLTSKLLYDWNWNIASIAKEEQPPQPQPQMGPDGQPMQGPPGLADMANPGAIPGMPGGPPKTSAISPAMAQQALQSLTGNTEQVGAGRPSPFGEANAPINLLQAGGMPPTPRGVPAKGGALNRGGKVNTNIPLKETTNPEAQIQNRAGNIQK